MRSIVNLLLENWMYVGLALVALFAVLCLISESLRDQSRKMVTLLLILIGIGLGYYVITGKTPSKIPGDINRYFGDSQVEEEVIHNYYRDPTRRSGGDQLTE